MDISAQLSAYLGFISILFIISLFWFLYLAKLVQNRKIKGILRRKRMNSTIGNNPEVSNRDLKEQAVERIETRFSNLRKLIVPVLFGLYALLVAFPFLGYLPAAYVSILVAGFGVTIGIAAKPFVENIISGVIMSFGKSIRIGDTIEIDGQYSTVEDISLTYTVLKVWDWKRYIIPNAQLLQKEILNYSLFDKDVWAYIEFYVHPRADLDLVKKLASESAKSSKHYNSKEEPNFWVMELGERSTKCWLATWARNPSEAWELKSDMRTALNKALRENQINTHNLSIETTGNSVQQLPDSK